MLFWSQCIIIIQHARLIFVYVIVITLLLAFQYKLLIYLTLSCFMKNDPEILQFNRDCLTHQRVRQIPNMSSLWKHSTVVSSCGDSGYLTGIKETGEVESFMINEYFLVASFRYFYDNVRSQWTKLEQDENFLEQDMRTVRTTSKMVLLRVKMVW